MTSTPAPKIGTARKLGSPAIVLALFGILLIFSFVTTPDLGSFATTLLSGLFQGMLLFLVASGLSLIFGLLDVLNFAQGTFFMLGAYVCYTIHHDPGVVATIPDPNVRFFCALLSAAGVGVVLGIVMERVLLRPLYARPIFQIVMTFGVSIVLTELIREILTTTPRSSTCAVVGFLQGNFTFFRPQYGL